MQPHYVKSTKLTGVEAADDSNSGPDTSRNTNGAPPPGEGARVGTPMEGAGFESTSVPHVDP